MVKKILAYIEILRPFNAVMGGIAVYVASIVAGLEIIPILPVILAMVVVFLVTGAGMAINDYFDEEIDRINKPSRPIPSGRIPSKAALLYSSILFAVAIGISYFINTEALIVAAFSSFLLIIYAWKFKKMLVIGHVSVGILTGLTFIYGGLINMNLLAVSILAGLAMLANIGREIFKTIEDVLGDEQSNVQSIPIKYGTIKAKMIASLFIMAAVAASFIPFFLGLFGFVYLFFVVGADIIFMAAIGSSTKWAPKLCKIAMNVALIAFLVGALA